MLKTVIRKEHKNQWEKRSPLTPTAVAGLREQGFDVAVETSEIRIFSDQDFQKRHIPIVSGPDAYEFVVGIKEPPISSIGQGQVHLAFSHTIKGQDYNMPLLQRFLDQGATLIDYEPIINDQGQRTIAFGRYAGIAGAIDTLHIMGKKWQHKNIDSALEKVKATIHYQTIDEIKQAFSALDLQSGEPVKILVVGTGKVGQGAIEVCRWLGLPELPIEDLLSNRIPTGSWFAVARTQHLHQSSDDGVFDFADFVAQGKEKYHSTFYQLLGRFNILLQTPFWTDKYPKHLTQAIMTQYADKLPVVIGDISCDIGGSLECTVRASTIDEPAYTYEVASQMAQTGINWSGPTVMAIDNLPCELALDASEHFSEALVKYMPQIIAMDLSQSYSALNLSRGIKRAIIVYKGELTPDYQYLREFL